jgi:hypothetical protein
MSNPLRFLTAISFAALVLAGCGRSADLMSPENDSRPGLGLSRASVTTVVLNVPAAITIQPSGLAAIQACLGETVTIAGSAGVVGQEVTLSDGTVVLSNLHINPRGAVAVGDVTGTTYRLVGGESNPVTFTPNGGLSATFEATLAAIGPGSASNFRAHILEHITITPSGEVTALLEIFNADCS